MKSRKELLALLRETVKEEGCSIDEARAVLALEQMYKLHDDIAAMHNMIVINLADFKDIRDFFEYHFTQLIKSVTDVMEFQKRQQRRWKRVWAWIESEVSGRGQAVKEYEAKLKELDREERNGSDK